MHLDIFSGDADVGRIEAALNELTSNIRFFQSIPENTRVGVVEPFRNRLRGWGETLLQQGSLPIEGYYLAAEILTEAGQIIGSNKSEDQVRVLAQQLRERGDALESWWVQINEEHPRAYVGMTSRLLDVTDAAETLLTELRSTMRESGLTPRVEVVEIGEDLERLIRNSISPSGGAGAVDPLLAALWSLSPQEFEDFVADQLRSNGFYVMPIGRVYDRDGGIDMVAVPEQGQFPGLIAVQVKHHRGGQKTPVSSVRDFAGAIYNRPFSAGVFVTNTSFTPDARAFAKISIKPLFLRDFESLKQWVSGNFIRDVEWRELPETINLAPGITIPLHELLSTTSRKKRA